MTPYSAAADGSCSRRGELAVGRLANVFGQRRGIEPLAQLGTSACSGSASPSSCWIAFSCWRRKYSRWPFSISDCTCDWIFEPSSNTSSSRFRIAETCPQARLDVDLLEDSWRSSVLIVRRVDATRWQSALGSSTFAAASCSSSGRYGASPMIRAKRPWTLRVNASTSGVSSSTSGSSLNGPTRYGSVGDPLVEADSLEALDEDAQGAVGHFDHLVDHGPPCRSRRGRPSPGASTEASRRGLRARAGGRLRRRRRSAAPSAPGRSRAASSTAGRRPSP